MMASTPGQATMGILLCLRCSSSSANRALPFRTTDDGTGIGTAVGLDTEEEECANGDDEASCLGRGSSVDSRMGSCCAVDGDGEDVGGGREATETAGGGGGGGGGGGA